jgi:hypothetical protein
MIEYTLTKFKEFYEKVATKYLGKRIIVVGSNYGQPVIAAIVREKLLPKFKMDGYVEEINKQAGLSKPEIFEPNYKFAGVIDVDTFKDSNKDHPDNREKM